MGALPSLAMTGYREWVACLFLCLFLRRPRAIGKPDL
jgi:hypothetical protein